jgi:Domain of unknown function (DUF4261)
MSAYAADLLCAATPTINAGRLLDQLRGPCGAVEMRPAPRRAEAWLFAFADYTFVDEIGKAQVPQILIAPNPKALAYEELRPALQQSRDWPSALQLFPQHQATVLISDFLPHWPNHIPRLELFHKVVTAVLAQVSCLALHWQPSQRLVDPALYLAKQRQGNDPVFPAIHLRHFQIEDPLLKETVVDTCGLAALGLPDLQCHFAGLDPDAVGRVLYQTARVLFAQGDLLQNGDTIAGVMPDQRWRCQRGMALVGPAREVIDVQPEAPYAPKKQRQ